MATDMTEPFAGIRLGDKFRSSKDGMMVKWEVQEISVRPDAVCRLFMLCKQYGNMMPLDEDWMEPAEVVGHVTGGRWQRMR